MKLVGLTAAALACSMAMADQAANFAANKAEERARILALKQKAWDAKVAQREAKDAENESVRAEKDAAKANSWAQKEAVREAKDEANESVRAEKDAAKANSWAIKEAVREMKDRANEIIRARKDAAKANSWEIRQVIRDRKDAMKAVVDLNRATAKAAQAALRAKFWDIRADQKVNFNHVRAGLKTDEWYCHNTDDVSTTWSASDNSIAIDGFESVHNGQVAIGRSSAESGNYFVTLVGGFGNKIYAVSGGADTTPKRSPFGKFQDMYWSISGSEILEPSNDVLNVEVAHASDYDGTALNWYLCTQRVDESNPCQAEPCKNGGTCSVAGDDATCDCIQAPVAYEGPTCETCTCENTSDLTACQVFSAMIPDFGSLQGCDFLEHCNVEDPCDKYNSKCEAMQSSCGSGEIQAFTPCVLLDLVGKTCEE